MGVKQGNQHAAKYAPFEHKRYLRMLVMTGECPLTHHERLVLSYRVYKARDGKVASFSKIARLLGVDRHTVAKAVRSLESRSVYVDNPALIKPEWFAKPHKDGSLRCYRHYYVEIGLSELENTLYWMLWSLTKDRSVKQSKSGLSILTNYSRYRVILGLRNLESKHLIKMSGREITLFDPPTLAFWKDRVQKPLKRVVKTTHEPILTEDWLTVLVEVATEGTPSDKLLLVQMIEKKVGDMKALAGIPVDRCEEYWRSIVRMIPDADLAWDFACYKFDYLLKNALEVHRQKGQAKSCIGILNYLTSQKLSN